MIMFKVQELQKGKPIVKPTFTEIVQDYVKQFSDK